MYAILPFPIARMITQHMPTDPCTFGWLLHIEGSDEKKQFTVCSPYNVKDKEQNFEYFGEQNLAPNYASIEVLFLSVIKGVHDHKVKIIWYPQINTDLGKHKSPYF